MYILPDVLQSDVLVHSSSVDNQTLLSTLVIGQGFRVSDAAL